MATTKTVYGSTSQSWTVPDNVTEITVECWGAQGDGLGGYIKGTLSTTPNETLELVAGGSSDGYQGGFPNGGDAGKNNQSSGGGGGGSSHVMRGGTTQSDVVILAGGGGGNGSASSQESPDTTDGANANGGTADDAEKGGYVASGGEGGGASDWNGGQGSSSVDEDDNEWAAGGGGGGGYNGGGGGGATTNGSSNSSAAAGGGGGDSYGGGVSNVTTTDAVQSGDGKIKLTYDEPPSDPSNLDDTVDNEVNVELSWTDNSNKEDSFEIYRSLSSGVDETDNLIATVNGDVTSYIDSFNSDVDHYYAVRAMNGTVPSNFSNEIHVEVGSMKYYDGTSWIAKTVYHGSSLDVAKKVDVL
jgi:hypothetical protein